MNDLNEYRQKCVSDYLELAQNCPQLFSERKRRKLILDGDQILKFSQTENQLMGLVAETAFFLFLVDLVSFADGNPHAYSRLITRKSLDGAEGVVVIPVVNDSRLGNPGDIVLVQQERHAIGESMIELPRGFAEPGVKATDQALEELKSETGYGGQAISIGRTYTDSGATDSIVNYVLVLIDKKSDAKPEVNERIESVDLVNFEKIWDRINSGKIKDGFTVQGMAFFERYRNNQ